MNAPIVSAHPRGPAASAPHRAVTVSLVSHGHSALAQQLLLALAQRHEGLVAHVILTHNIPGPSPVPPAGGWPFRVTERHNPAPLGFGANHNRAFADGETGFFCVLNPDVELPAGPLWAPLVEAASQPGVGLAYPRLRNTDGTPQDSEREAVTPLSLLRRHLLRRGERRADWVSAAFWLVPRAAYQQLGGFDERYFMYCEDTDFCLRLRLAGFSLAPAPAWATHAAGHASRRPGRHLAWHLRSLLRLWTGPVLRHYLADRQKTPRQ